MQLTIFDVDHGACALLQAPTGYTMLIDAGHSSSGFRPSLFLPAQGIRRIDSLVITNYDEDHISDLAQLRRVVDIRLLFRNDSMSSQQLRSLKLLTSGAVGPGMSSLLEMIDTYTLAPSETEGVASAGDLGFETFANPYPQFANTNNLSLVLFVRYGSSCFVFPGDLEEDGWKVLLERAAFRAWLRLTNVFIASHHGRLSGYYPEVFDHCKPTIVVASDCSVHYDTQVVNYGQHASGVLWNGGPERRFYLTTRCDGTIHFACSEDRFYVTVNSRSY